MLYKKKDTKKSRKNPENFPKIFWNKFFFDFFISKSRNREEFTKFNLENESRNSGDHEFWNHEMRGSPVSNYTDRNNLVNLAIQVT